MTDYGVFITDPVGGLRFYAESAFTAENAMIWGLHSDGERTRPQMMEPVDHDGDSEWWMVKTADGRILHVSVMPGAPSDFTL
tara:strand:+ start:70 stop:315 length:246 start_codon:yes stop_codon:yes gene_type:complete